MRVVITGGTGGIGAEAARRLLGQGHQVTVGARDTASVPAGATAEPLDLADLASVRRFTDAVAAGGAIDALVLNAGLQGSKQRRSAQGYELTFAVNHLAHYLLLRTLLDRVPITRVVVTASGVHDPAEKTPVPPPLHADAGRLARPETDPQRDASAFRAGARAYSASKLANVMTVRALRRRYPDVTSIAYDPAYVPGTGLARTAPRALVWLFERVAVLMMRRDRRSTVPRSGAALAALASDPAYVGERGAYWSMRGELVRAEPSELARDDAAGERLWADSARLVGLPT